MSAPKLPDGLPPLPEGAVYLGNGAGFVVDGRFTGWAATKACSEWVYDNGFGGTMSDVHYAAPIGSEIARLNGHGVEPAPDSEAVALVRKLADIMSRAGDCIPNDGGGTAYELLGQGVKEAEAFLKREAGK